MSTTITKQKWICISMTLFNVIIDSWWFMFFNANDQIIICYTLLILLKINSIGIIKHKNLVGRRLQFKQPICIIIYLIKHLPIFVEWCKAVNCH